MGKTTLTVSEYLPTLDEDVDMTIPATRSSSRPIAFQFSFDDPFILAALDGLSPVQLWQRLSPRSNPMLWIAGHVAQTRASVLGLLGTPVDTGWGNGFDRGATVGDPKGYPARDEIERVLRNVSPQLSAQLAMLDESTLGRPGTAELPFAPTLADELAFFATHDAYHVGQMAFIRKALGYPGVAG